MLQNMATIYQIMNNRINGNLRIKTIYLIILTTLANKLKQPNKAAYIISDTITSSTNITLTTIKNLLFTGNTQKHSIHV